MERNAAQCGCCLALPAAILLHSVSSSYWLLDERSSADSNADNADSSASAAAEGGAEAD